MIPLQKFLADHDVGEIEDYDIVLEGSRLGEAGQLQLFLSAWPWWRTPLPGAEARASLTIDLVGIVQSEGSLYWGALPITDLLVSTSGRVLRDFGPWQELYGSSPIRDPDRFFVQFHDVCVSLGATQRAIAYTGRETFREFEHFVSKNSYFLLDAPMQVIDAARPLLDMRGVQYSCLPGRKPHPHHESLIEVAFDERWVVCREALITTTE